MPEEIEPGLCPYCGCRPDPSTNRHIPGPATAKICADVRDILANSQGAPTFAHARGGTWVELEVMPDDARTFLIENPPDIPA